MINKVFTVYDSKAEIYLNPFLMKNKAEALRAFIDIANDPTTQIGKHPEDFTLFEIGEFDYDRGEHCNHPAKISLGVALEFKIKTNSDPIQ